MKKVSTPRFPSKVRRLSALVSVALWAGLPFAARAEAPAVTWQAPLSGAVLRGTIGGSTCAVDARTIRRSRLCEKRGDCAGPITGQQIRLRDEPAAKPSRSPASWPTWT